MTNEEKEQIEKQAFNTGYVVAVCNMMNLHGEDVVALDTLAQLGITREEINAMNLTEYDLEALEAIYD